VDPDTTGPSRTRADDFSSCRAWEAVALKLYIGCGGRRQTYRMLEEAPALQERGRRHRDRFARPHARRHHRAPSTGLEVVPRRQIEYRGVVVEEMSLTTSSAQAGLHARRRAGHTNVPGSRKPQALQDVMELPRRRHQRHRASTSSTSRAQGHRQRVTGVAIRETVPDSFSAADQVVTWISRWRICRSGCARARSRSPTRGLGARPLLQGRQPRAPARAALREVAESVERFERAGGPPGRPAVATSVPVRAAGSWSVCRQASPRGAPLVRKGSRSPVG